MQESDTAACGDDVSQTVLCATALAVISGFEWRRPEAGMGPERCPAKYKHGDRYDYCGSTRLYHFSPGTKWRFDVYARFITEAVQQLILVEVPVLRMLRPKLRYFVPAAAVRLPDIERPLAAVRARHDQNTFPFDSG